jgi:pSer/pThr/pTyr-binding forkhead associated (FHA) protein
VARAFDFAGLLKQVQSLARDAFIKNWPGYYLLTAPSPQIATPQRFITEPAEPSPAGQVSTPTRTRFELQPLAKSGGKSGADRISVGRARNCDIILRHASVSKLHAHFRLDGDYVAILDNSSRNGTAVNDEPLIPEQRTQLRSGDRIRIGALETILFDAAGLYRFLHV